MSPTPKLTRAPKRQRLKSRQDADAVVTSMVLPRKLHKDAIDAAYALNWSLAELTRRALEEWLDRHAAELRKAEQS